MIKLGYKIIINATTKSGEISTWLSGYPVTDLRSTDDDSIEYHFTKFKMKVYLLWVLRGLERGPIYCQQE